MSVRFGVDLGGTKIALVALDAAGAEVYRRRVPTPASEGAEAIVRAIRDLVHAAESAIGRPGSVGLGTPGALSPATGLLRNSNTTALNGRPLDRELAAALGRPVRLANDANCFALSEASDGAAAGAEVVFGVIVGTGTGGGVIVRGRALTGPNAIAGEWGHTPLPWPTPDEVPGPPCYCGRRGCVETWLSGPGLARDHEA
ncbi:MAG: ROK family protein, partial [Myxococcota bacterium]